MMFSWLKYLRSFISRSVRRQNMEWSKGVIFLMATFWPEGLCSAELYHGKGLRQRVSKCQIGGCSLPDYSICALSDYILDIVLLRHIERDLPGAVAPCGARHCSGLWGDGGLRGCAGSIGK